MGRQDSASEEEAAPSGGAASFRRSLIGAARETPSMLFLAALSVALAALVGVGSAEGEPPPQNVTLSPALRRFLGATEPWEQTPNDLVFLLDESGSIEAHNFPQVKLLAELIVRRFSVSSAHSRVAVLTFSTGAPRSHVDHVRSPAHNNMCTLIRAIHDIDYAGGWTHTFEAMVEARNVLQEGRTDANKIVVLISDGQSNDGHSPVDIALQLKQQGVVIFAVGVAEVNEAELLAVATSADHVYVLKEFQYIYRVNEYIKGEVKEVSWDAARDASPCDGFCGAGADCCDAHAACYCGTKGGHYECACAPGHRGSGHRGECHPCPKGTFKSRAGNHPCQPCPAHATTVETGSTAPGDCFCSTGFAGDPAKNISCDPVRCARLSAPAGGRTVPDRCDDRLGSQCAFRCSSGFCPHACDAAALLSGHLPWDRPPDEPRTCLPSGQWSGPDFRCEKVRCPVLELPGNGKHNCTGPDLHLGPGVGCHFACDKGYRLAGSPSRTCLLNGTWTGWHVSCEAVQCEPLKANEKLLLKPPQCGVQRMPYRSVCQYACRRGFELTARGGAPSDGVHSCLADGSWSGALERLHCADVTPPNVVCPGSVTVEADRGAAFAAVAWAVPVATDNVQAVSLVVEHPPGLRKPPHHFPVGPPTKVVYRATDSAGLNDTCFFTVTVLDKEPPQVLSCPGDVVVYHAKRTDVSVQWTEPEFQDNSGQAVSVSSSRRSGAAFAWGPAGAVRYAARDPSGNVAACEFAVIVKPHPCPFHAPPAHGALTCDDWQGGRMCSVFCPEGFAFTDAPQPYYFCHQPQGPGQDAGRWGPMPGAPKAGRFRMPWPDCARKRSPGALSVAVDADFRVPGCDPETLRSFREQFIESLLPLEKKFAGLFCPKDKGCAPENVNVTCHASRAKRSFGSAVKRASWRPAKRHRTRHAPRPPGGQWRRSADAVLSVSFSFQMDLEDPAAPGNLCEDCDAEDAAGRLLELDRGALSAGLGGHLSGVLREAYGVPAAPLADIGYRVAPACLAGQLARNGSCLSCPAGTYKDDLQDACVECPSATYQDSRASLSCRPCPVGHTTYSNKSTSPSDCKGPCEPGSYSRTSFAPCLACPADTYQPRPGRQDCLGCPAGLRTGRPGADALAHCVSACAPGSHSTTGFEPCAPCAPGTYQAKEQQVACDACPEGTGTGDPGARSPALCRELRLCEALRPCAEGATCRDTGDDWACLCPEARSGRRCERREDDCLAQPCLNDGACVDGACRCAGGFEGTRCEIDVDDCQPDPCQNGGKCVDGVGNYSCECAPGFAGPTCDTDIFECASDPCRNNGTCFDKVNGYRCCCPAGFAGASCELAVDPCDELRCLNGGACVATHPGRAECVCADGYGGSTCEVDVDDCAAFLCDNGGSCVDGVHSATCRCAPLYDGPRCEEALPREFSLGWAGPLTSRYAALWNARPLSELTVAFFMRTDHKEPASRATPFSYSYREPGGREEDNAFTLSDLNRLVFYLHGQPLHTGHSANSDSEWHHYALTWAARGRWAFYVDAAVVVSGAAQGEGRPLWPGVFVLGQEQDSLGGTFSIAESFVGEIAQFDAWDAALSGEVIRDLREGCGLLGNVVSWPATLKHLHGDLSVTEHWRRGGDLRRALSVGACADAPCANGQPCVGADDATASCDCDAAYAGRLCQFDVDECLTGNGNCSHECVNESPGHSCLCPEGMRLRSDRRRCQETRFCKQDKFIFSNDEEWESECRHCTCVDGDVTCRAKECPDVDCQQDETLVLIPGECCEKCVFLPSICLVASDDLVTTFKAETFEFSGSCRHTLVEDCVDGRYRVTLESDELANRTDNHKAVERTAGDAAIARSLAVLAGCTEVRLDAGGGARVDGAAVALPFRNGDVLVRQGAGNASGVEVWARPGFTAQFRASTGESLVAVEHAAAARLCGVCGRFDAEDAGARMRHLGERSATGPGRCYLRSYAPSANGSGRPCAALVHLLLSLLICRMLDHRG